MSKKMSAFTNLIANLFSGFLPSVISMFTGLDNKGWTPDRGAQHVAEDLASLQDQNLISNYFRKTTGASLTDAERESNEWSRQQVLDAWDRQMVADNTKYQRQVQDMQAAGLNPMLAAGSSVHVPSAAVASSVSPSAAAFNLGDIASLLRLGADIKNIEADTAKKAADTAKTESETREQDIISNFAEERERLRNEGLGISNSLNLRQVKLLSKNIEDLDSQIELRKEQSKSEVERRQLMFAQSILAKANSYQVAEMLPYAKALSEAQTDQAKKNAAFAAAQAMYQNGLLSSGMIEAQVSKIISEIGNIRESERYTKIKADVANIEKAMREGHDPENWAPDSIFGAITSTVFNFLEVINPLSKLGL